MNNISYSIFRFSDSKRFVWFSLNIKKLISDALKCKPKSEESKRKMSEAKKGKKLPKFTDEHKIKISEAMKGHIVSEESRERNRLSHLGKNNTCNVAYKDYKANGGTLSWNEFQKENKKCHQ